PLCAPVPYTTLFRSVKKGVNALYNSYSCNPCTRLDREALWSHLARVKRGNYVMNTIPPLKKGDKVAITCPASHVSGDISAAYETLISWGLDRKSTRL